jgi:AraC-like DNA-binding protein
MEGIINFIEKNMDNSEHIIDDFAKELNMGRTIFYQKMKNITGLSPIDFVLTMRIKRAIQLMKTGKYNFSTIAYMTGFNDPKYFSKCFRKHTGMSPSEYLKQIRSEQ